MYITNVHHYLCIFQLKLLETQEKKLKQVNNNEKKKRNQTAIFSFSSSYIICECIYIYWGNLMAQQLQDNSSFLKANRKESLSEAWTNHTAKEKKKSTSANYISILSFFIVICPVHKQNVIPAVW